jgi:D-inositol-3-phosphate glycosyltransferase
MVSPPSPSSVRGALATAWAPPHRSAFDAAHYYGAASAAQGFVRALVEYSGKRPVALFVPQGSRHAAEQWLRAGFPPSARSGVRVLRPWDVLGNGRPSVDISVWHHVDGASTFLPFALRSTLCDVRVPITLVHHTVSYPSLLSSFFLRMLVDDVRPYDALVCTSRAARKAVTGLISNVRETCRARLGVAPAWRARLEVIPLGVDTRRFRPRNRAAARHVFRVPQEADVLLWVGRLSPADKADLLPFLRVFSGLVKSNRKRRLLLLVVGRGPALLALRQYARELGIGARVRFLAAVSNEQMPQVYSAADVLVSPVDSVQESFGLVPVEAMACGLPQIVSDWDGYRDTVEHGVTGFRVPTYWLSCDEEAQRLALWPFSEGREHLLLGQSVVVDVEAMGARIQTLLDSPRTARDMSRRSRERAVRQYSWEAVLGQYEDLWRDLERQATRDHTPPPRELLERAPFFEAFQGHASVTSPAHFGLQLSAAGTRLLRGEEALPLGAGAEVVIDVELVSRVLNAAGGGVSGISSPDAIVRRLKPRGRVEVARVKRHLMWLAKYGFLALTEQRAAGQVAVVKARS